MARVVILGGGFGGITVATELAGSLGSEHEIVLVDRAPEFTMGLRKLWAVVEIGPFKEGSRSRDLLSRKGVHFLRREITRIDAVARVLQLGEDLLEADYLVVALGAETRPDLVPGLKDYAHNVWDATGVPALRVAIADLHEGHIAIVIAGVPYACPPAPYECAFLLEEHLRDRGVRDRVSLSVTTLQPMLLPNAGKEGSAWLAAQLEERGIQWTVGRKVERFEAGEMHFADGVVAADLIIGVPPHRVPTVVAASGLTGDGDWIRVDPQSLETRFEKVYAIGDVTHIQLANGLPLPKAGVMAEAEGRRVAAAIAAELRGEAPPPGFDGEGFCFLEMGKSRAALIEGTFFSQPEPRVRVGEMSLANAEAKRRFESERLEQWFGK